MTVSITDIRTRFPEFSDDTEYPDPTIQLFIDDAVNVFMGTDEVRWGGKYDYALAYLTAHLLASGENTELGDTSASSGPISSKSVAGVAVAYAVVAKDRSEGDSFLASTSYGQRYITIRNRCFVGVLIANQL